MEELIGVSERWQGVKRLIRELAQFPTVTVLIVGETGTGKELVAQALHRATFPAQAPFIALNCSAIPEHLLESELFGSERGAFTGATRTKKGFLELAHGGTLFLDEIGELNPAMQPKLLRVLETRNFTRLGGTRKIRVDCRLLCATNKPLRFLVAEGKFRADLFHRLNTFTLSIPPLRERREDILPLVEAFIAQANLRLQKVVQGISPEALALLVQIQKTLFAKRSCGYHNWYETTIICTTINPRRRTAAQSRPPIIPWLYRQTLPDSVGQCTERVTTTARHRVGMQ